MTTKKKKIVIDTSFEEFYKSFMDEGDTTIEAHEDEETSAKE